MQEYPAHLIRRIAPADIASAKKSTHSIRKEDFKPFSKALEESLQKYLNKEPSVKELTQLVVDALDKSSAKESIRVIVLDRLEEKRNSSTLTLSYLYDYILCNMNQRVIKI